MVLRTERDIVSLFKTEAAAKRHIRDWERKQEVEEEKRNVLVRRIGERAQKLSGDKLFDATRALDVLKGAATLEAAATFYIAHHMPGDPTRDVNELVEDYADLLACSRCSSRVSGWPGSPNWSSSYVSPGTRLQVEYLSSIDVLSRRGRREGIARPERPPWCVLAKLLGVSKPRLLCGRSSLYSRRQSSSTTLASVNVQSCSRSRPSSRKRAWKLSIYPFCHGLPGSM